MSASANTSEDVSAEDYLPIEQVAERLDLPLGVLIRRVEAGDVPARRSEGPDGARYSVRVSDLGFGAEDAMGPRDEEASTDQAPQPLELLGAASPSSWPDKVVPAPAEELAAVVATPTKPASGANGTADGRVPAVRPLEHHALAPVNGTPRSEVAAMALDPRELVAGLLDRWERTLEQRIYAEQRQRFEMELNARQNLLKQLQLELQTARAEHAAAQADKDRVLAERERQLADLQRDLDTARAQGPRRRSWPFRS
ncbi:MAG TPA: hypothetical protein VJU79_10320 [Candidatus Dormibacteraeota bacterium]|nr:hypothetical protein [Candidatus Dormibacteraeota bacterium]